MVSFPLPSNGLGADVKSISSTVNTKVEFAGIVAIALAPYPNSEGIVNTALSPL